MNNKRKIILFGDEQNDEFSGITRKTKTIDENYPFIRKNHLFKLTSYLLYWLMLPVAYIYTKLKFSLKIENKRILKNYQKEGIYLYGNHTQIPGDGFIQSLVSFPKKSTVVVNADNVSLKGTNTIMQMLGALPIGNTIKGYKAFMHAIKEKSLNQETIVIYPEAHIWPYYTKIRNFKKQSFYYPVKNNKPVFSFTAIYKKRKIIKTPKIIIKIDGPFYPNKDLNIKDAEQNLRDIVFAVMSKRATESNYEYITYKNKEEILSWEEQI